ncbi:MAG: hypothetical protein ACYCOU_01165 [Sulfobacillus sp.]
MRPLFTGIVVLPVRPQPSHDIVQYIKPALGVGQPNTGRHRPVLQAALGEGAAGKSEVFLQRRIAPQDVIGWHRHTPCESGLIRLISGRGNPDCDVGTGSAEKSL